jgi:hypothetical protein
MNKAINYLQKLASGKTVFITCVLTMAVYLLMLLYSIPRVESYAPGIALFDLSPTGYSYQHAISLLETLGETGRNVYLYQQLPIDFVYPGLFAISYSLLLAWLFKKSFPADSKLFYLAVVPVFAGFFDYLENVAIISMIRSFPGLPQELVGIASLFSTLKSLFTMAFFILLFLGIIALFASSLKRKPQLPTHKKIEN